MTLKDDFAKMDYFEQITINAIWNELVQECININNTGTTYTTYLSSSLVYETGRSNEI